MPKSAIVIGGKLNLLDDLSPDEVANPTLYKAKRKHQVRLKYTRDSRTDLANTWSLSVDYRIFATTDPGVYEEGTVTIVYNPGGAAFVYESLKEHTGGGAGYGDVTVSITGVTPSGTVPSDVVLELTTVLERYTDLDGITVPKLSYSAATSEISWTYVPGAEEYDLEYVHIDAYENHGGFSSADGPFEYKPPVRITTSNQYFLMDNVFPDGTVYFRVRAVGRHINNTGTDYSHVNNGVWGYFNNSGVAVTNHFVNSFESDKNWTYAAGFSEDGKSKKGINYIDGSEKIQQTQVSMNSDNTTIVTESKYDIEGRPVLSILPVPVNNVGVTDMFKYKPFFNTDVNGGQYDNLDFQGGTDPMGTGSGAGKYYSSANTATDNAMKFTPDANGYPFTQIAYTRDNTGRISMTASGAGDLHKIGSGHELKYFYGSANSTELHRLFGTNVGLASHYKKNYVMDANGQVSVNYLNQEARTIATALTGPSPSNLEELEENVKETLTVSLNDNNVYDALNRRKSQVSSIVNTNPEGEDYTFSYDMKGVIYETDIVVPEIKTRNEITGEVVTCQPEIDINPICADCIYKLSIQITDPDGLIVQIPDNSTLVDKLTRTFSNPSNPNCENNQYDADGITFTLEFDKIGTYTVNKILELDTTGIDEKMTVAMNDIGLDSYYQTNLWNCLGENTDYSQCDITCEQECKTVIHREHPTWSELDEDFIEALNICKQTNCDPQVVIDQQINDMILSPCNDMLKILKSEVAPGGFEFVQNNPYVSTQTDLDYWDRVDYLMDAFAALSLSTDPTDEQLKDRSYIIFLDNDNHLLVPQPSLSDIKNADFWNGKNKEQWILQLVKADRDYCHYENCLKKAASDIYDVKLSQIADAATAKSLGYLDPMGMSRTTPYEDGGSLIPLSFPSGVGTTGTDVYVDYLLSGVDPLFEKRYLEIGAKRNGMEIPCEETVVPCEAYEDLAKMLSINSSSFNDGNGHSDIWHYVFDANSVLYTTPSGAGLDFNNEELKWKLFRGLYLSEKLKWENSHLTTSCLCCPYYEDSKIQHPHYNNEIVPTDEKIQESYDMVNDCGEKCTYNVIRWMDQLQHYVNSTHCSSWSSIPAGTKTSIEYNLLQYCQSQCGSTNPGGLILESILSPSLSNTYLLAVKSSLPTPCQPALDYLSDGDPYTITCKNSDLPKIQATKVSSCFATMVQFISGKSNGCYDMGSSCLGGQYLKISGSSFMVSSSASCTPVSCGNHVFRFYTPSGYALPANEITSIALPVYTAYTPVVGVSGVFMNVQCVANTTTKGVIQVYLYEEAESGCTDYAFTETVILYDPASPSMICVAGMNESEQMIPSPDYDEQKQQCIERLYARNLALSKKLYQNQVKLFKEAYLKAHYSNCFSSYQEEKFRYSYESSEYHYTLYYYDQAGNLIQTVPPKGVHVVPATAFSSGEYDGTTEPAHTFLTRYTYDGLNNVRSQETPDGGLTTYYYDQQGRLLASQNAKQKAASTETFSYTKYDYISRIIEIGESNGDPEISVTPFTTNDVTDIVYDYQTGYSSRFKTGQQFLRNRISSVNYREGSNSAHTASTHYSYDVHGNVNELLQVNPTLSLFFTETENTFKYMTYRYDLISRNVKEVAYQPGKADQFYHRYLYDADNRLKVALTSNNGIIWEKDAKYFYYKHGPLNRTEIGEDKVQGMDYAYTINGWLKGINATSILPGNDMGRDGTTGNNLYIARSALAFTLGYYDDDYSSVGTSNWQATTKSTPLSTGDYKNLYNGNIARTTSSFLNFDEEAVNIMGKSYTYDQLNRLKSANAYTGPTIAESNSFSGALNNGNYQEMFDYDPNGNILNASRYGDIFGLKMDNFTYNYATNTNKLQQVTDAGTDIDDGNYEEDIDNQTDSDNYGYHENGSLKWDKAEEIAAIEWNVYGKVKSITRISTSTKSDLEFKYDAGGQRICKIVKPRTGSGLKNEEDWVYSYYTRDAQGNVMAVYDRKLTLESGVVKDRYKLKEHHIYGSSRLGVEQKDVNLGELDFADGGYDGNAFVRPPTGTVIAAGDPSQPQRIVGDKQYELSNHLSNVIAVISDKKIGVDSDDAGTEKQAEEYKPDVISAMDYYAFGAIMPGRNYNDNLYRYGFNSGSEKDDEINGVGNHYTTEWRELDPRLGGRWWSPDRIVKPWESPYAGFSNNPIYFSDPSGLDPTEDKKPQGNTENTTGTWETRNSDGSLTGKTADPVELPEVEVCGNCDESATSETPATSTTSDVAKGTTANKTVNRYQLNDAKGNTKFGIDDKYARTKPNGKVVSDWVIRFDEPHGKVKTPHINLNEKLTGFKDPHTPISNKILTTVEYGNKGLKVLNKVATPIAVVVDAKRIYDAVEQSHGNVMSKTVVVTVSDVAGGWVGAFGGAAIGAEGGMYIGGLIGSVIPGAGTIVGAAVGGFVGGLVGGIGGALGGSWFGHEAADTYYKE